MTLSAHLSDTGTIMTQARMQHLLEAANLLINARRNHKPIADLPAELQPKSLEEAAIIHGMIATAFGPIGGWKIGAGSADATPFFAPRGDPREPPDPKKPTALRGVSRGLELRKR